MSSRSRAHCAGVLSCSGIASNSSSSSSFFSASSSSFFRCSAFLRWYRVVVLSCASGSLHQDNTTREGRFHCGVHGAVTPLLPGNLRQRRRPRPLPPSVPVGPRASQAPHHGCDAGPRRAPLRRSAARVSTTSAAAAAASAMRRTARHRHP